MNGGDLVVRTLSKYGIGEVFSLLGNQLYPMLVAGENYGVHFTGVREEQATIQMAAGWAHVKKHTGCVMVIGGPGFTNIITGIVKSYYDQVPVLVIVGKIDEKNKDRRQMHDVEHSSLIRQYCKAFYSVDDVNRIEEYVGQAIHLASDGIMGPVILEIPLNILTSEVEENATYTIKESKRAMHLLEKDMEEILQLINNSSKPIIILGDRLHYSKNHDVICNLVEALKMPVFCLSRARGIISDSHEFCFGSAKVLTGGVQLYAYKEADLILAFGVTPDYHVGNFEEPYFNEEQIFIEFDTEGKQYCELPFSKQIKVSGDLSIIAEDLLTYLNKVGYDKSFNGWMCQMTSYEAEIMEDIYYNLENEVIHPASLISLLNQYKKDDAIVVTDGGNAALWGELLFKVGDAGSLIVTSEGRLGCIGCGLATAIGVKIAAPDKEVILYTGDGSFGYNLSEIDTACTYNAGIKVVIHNDEAWGFCKYMQLKKYNKEVIANLQKIEYEKIVETFGGKGFSASNVSELNKIVKEFILEKEVTCLNVLVDKEALCGDFE